MKIKNKLFDEASGSIGGFTFAGSQGGMYMKNKSNPKKFSKSYDRLFNGCFLVPNFLPSDDKKPAQYRTGLLFFGR
jgi:hypothetical protein